MLGKLSARSVETAKTAGLLSDGGGLYLQVTINRRTGSIRKSWVYRFRIGGRTREMGLGPVPAVTLAKAREAAQDARAMRAARVDPIENRREGEAAQQLAAGRAKSFKAVAIDYIELNQLKWRNPKHANQWASTLARYVYPTFGDVAVSAVSIDDVLKVLKPIWPTKTETASRVRGRIERILNYAQTCELRDGENPARWGGRLSNCLPPPSLIRTVRHHAAMPYPDVPAFVAKVRGENGVAAKALEFAILTAARTGEVTGAAWSEINLDEAIWTIPGNRMKGGRQHRVPLCRSAVELLKSMRVHPGAQEFVFCAPGTNKPISNMAMLALIERMGLHGQITTHGFRSSFRDWAEEQTKHDHAVAEAALAHVPGNKVVQAYIRGDSFDLRKKLMQDWDKYLSS